MRIWQFNYHDNNVTMQQILMVFNNRLRFLYANNVLFFFFDLRLKYDLFLFFRSVGI